MQVLYTSQIQKERPQRLKFRIVCTDYDSHRVQWPLKRVLYVLCASNFITLE